MKCENCGFETDGNFCGNCGKEVLKNVDVFCSECGQKINSNEMFCSNCGKSINSDNGGKKKSKKKHKKVKVFLIIIIVIVIIIAALIGIGSLVENNSSSSYDNDSSYDSGYNSYNSGSSGYSESDIETKAVQALYSELKRSPIYSSDYYDLSSTRYSIGTTEKDGNYWVVRGRFTLYDKYGSVSSHYNERFTVTISSTGYTECKLGK